MIGISVLFHGVTQTLISKGKSDRIAENYRTGMKLTTSFESKRIRVYYVLRSVLPRCVCVCVYVRSKEFVINLNSHQLIAAAVVKIVRMVWVSVNIPSK